MSTTGIKMIACVPSRRGESADSQHNETKTGPKKGASAMKRMVLTRKKRGSVEALQCPLALGHQVLKAMTLEELPEVKTLESKSDPTPLRWDSKSSPRHFGYTPTTNSLSLSTVFKNMFRGKVYPFRLSTALNMSSSAAGIVNSTINMQVVQSSTDFSAFSAIFQEFFITRCDVKWVPNSRYQYPIGGTSSLTNANLPIGCAQLHHTATVYSSLSSLLNNFGAALNSTGDPFHYSWVNVETPESKVETITTTTQGWCDTTSGQVYTGAMQFLSQSPPPALPASQVLGTFQTNFHCLFRVRE